MNIELPTTVSPALATNPQVLLMYGAPKIGKSTMLAGLKDTLLVDTEEGSDYVSAMKVKVHSLAELEELCKTIIAKGRPYKRIGYDTVTQIEDWCEAEATAMYKKSPVGSGFRGETVLALPQGAGYLWLRMAFKKYLDLMYSTADEVILIAHIKDKMLETATNGEVASTDLDLTGKIKRIICSQADAIGYIYRKKDETPGAPKDTTKLWISFKTQSTVNCGGRCPHLVGKDMEFKWESIYMPTA